VAKNAGLSFGGTVGIIFFKLTSSIIVTRTLGAELFGIYVLAIAILSFGQIIALFGFENTVVRFVSHYKVLEDSARLRGTLWGIVAFVFLLSIAVYAGLFAVSFHTAEKIFDKPALMPVLKIMVVSLPFTAVSRLLLAALQAVKLIKYKVYVQQFIIPIARILFITSAAGGDGFG